MSYEEYEKKSEQISAKNRHYLEQFRVDLEKSGLKEKTVRTHYFNVDLYINTYLLKEKRLEMSEGTSFENINDFFGHFVRKSMWCTSSIIKSTAASLKKFYKSMLERGHIEKAQYDDMIFTIQVMMEEWIFLCENYSDPDEKDPFLFF